jgi:hypothetical protein
MAGGKRRRLDWDPAIAGEFRRRLECALDGLKVNASDGETVDPDPESPCIAMTLASVSGGWVALRRRGEARWGWRAAGRPRVRLDVARAASAQTRWQAEEPRASPAPLTLPALQAD